MKNDNRPATYTRPQVEALLRKWMEKAAEKGLSYNDSKMRDRDIERQEVAASIVAGMKVEVNP